MTLLSESKNEFIKYKFVSTIIILIGFQQFPVLRIGGSLKLYEIIAIILVIFIIITAKIKPKIDLISALVKTLFVISPIISLTYAYIFLDYPTSFYTTYRNEHLSLKFSYSFFPILQLLYMFFNYAVIITIYKNDILYEKLDKLIKTFVIIGTCIAIYSLFSMFVIDLVPLLPELIQYKQPYIMRSTGLSQEPSFYVLYQSWVTLFTYYSKRYFRKGVWLILLIINILSLLLTFSTTILGLVAILFLSIFVLGSSLKTKLLAILASISFCLITYSIIVKKGLWDLFETLFINKLLNFVSTPDQTLDSGGFRSYTSRLGMFIFEDYKISGVGVGNSVYYMHIYDPKAEIVTYGETLSPGNFPQNLFSSVLAEQGLIGGIALFGFLIVVIYSLWKNRKKNELCRVFFIGGIFNIVTMFTIAPIYSLFLWVFLSLAMGYYKYKAL